jgi:hypothetical protein
LLGGDKQPKRVPEDGGYDLLSLQFTSADQTYIVERALTGGETAVFVVPREGYDNAVSDKVEMNVDIGELLVSLSGAADKQILRSASKRGPVTGGDLRHWFLLSQPAMISEDATSGAGHNQPQRLAAFHVFLSGSDDSAVILTKSKAEKDKIAGRIFSAEQGIKRAWSTLPADANKIEVLESLGRVDEALEVISEQHRVNSTALRAVRENLAKLIETSRDVRTGLSQSRMMIDRFALLKQKYINDIDRLNAVDEGVAYFGLLPTTPCVLCGTPFDGQPTANSDASGRGEYRQAISAETTKIRLLLSGLADTQIREEERVASLISADAEIRKGLRSAETAEVAAVRNLHTGLTADPRTLALRRSELSSQLDSLEEIDRLNSEIESLKKISRSKRTPVVRESHEAAVRVGDAAKVLLNAWGFKDVLSVTLDPATCDLVVNSRARLSYGAGKRSLFLTAMTIAILEHALINDLPHAGFVVIDSPLKAYADPDTKADDDVPLATVRDGFYQWLDKRKGPGQVVVLENEKVDLSTLTSLKPVEFSGEDGPRPGFYPPRAAS